MKELTKTRIGVFGTYGFGNMGDAAVADATIAGIKRHVADAEIVAICQQPENVESRHRVEAHSIFRDFIKNSEQVYDRSAKPQGKKQNAETDLKKRTIGIIKSTPGLYHAAKISRGLLHNLILFGKEIIFLFQILRIVRGLDLMVMSGSGQLNEEWGGPWRYPFGLFKWCLLARMSGCKIAFLSVGAGETERFWTRFFCATAMRLAHYRSVRDLGTKNLVESWGIKRVKLVPDMAFSMKLGAAAPSNANPKATIVGINPIAFCDPRTWNVPDHERYQQYVAKLAEFCDWLLAQDYRVAFIPNELVMDNLTIDDILSRLKTPESDKNGIIRPQTLNYSDVVKNLSKCDYMVACRFHGLLFSFMAGIPSIALAHHFKFCKLAEEMDQGRFCLNIEDFTVPALQSLLQELVNNHEALTRTIIDCSSNYAEKVEDQYRGMGRLLSANISAQAK